MAQKNTAIIINGFSYDKSRTQFTLQYGKIGASLKELEINSDEVASFSWENTSDVTYLKNMGGTPYQMEDKGNTVNGSFQVFQPFITKLNAFSRQMTVNSVDLTDLGRTVETMNSKLVVEYIRTDGVSEIVTFNGIIFLNTGNNSDQPQTTINFTAMQMLVD